MSEPQSMAVFLEPKHDLRYRFTEITESLCEEDACLLKNYRDAAAQIYHHGNRIIS